MKILLLPILLFLFSCSNSPLSGSGSSTSGVPELEVREVNLANGFKALLIPNKKIPVYSLYMYYKVGSKYEKKGITGASHFLEHMMFKGAKNFEAGRFDYLIEGNGGSSNAYTNTDFTVYYEKMPSPTLKTMIKVEADRMQNLLLDKTAFENERKVILEERRARYENSPRGKLYLTMMHEMQKGTLYKESVIGSIPDLKTVTRDQIHEYFKTYYTPNNAVLVLAGDFNLDEAEQWIKDSFSNIKKNQSLASVKAKVLKEKGHKIKVAKYRRKSVFGSSPRPMFSLAFPGVENGTRDAYVLDIISSVLGGGKSSYLNQMFVEGTRPKLVNIYAANYNLIHNGIFFISGELLGKVNLKKFEKKLNGVLKLFCERELTERNLQKVKNQILVSTYSGLDTNSGLATYIGDREAYMGDWRTYKKEFATYNSIDVKEAKQVCHKYLDQKGRVFISLWNKNKEKVNL